VISAWVVVLMLGQSDGGLSPPPLPPEAVPEGITFPRVIRNEGEVCVESLDESGAVKRECKPEKEVHAPPKPPPVDTEPLSRAVVDFGVHGGGLLVSTGALFPELALTADVGVRWRNGVGIVGLSHGHWSAAVNRYGLGLGLRLGDRSHITLALTLGPLTIAPNSFQSFTVFSGTVLAELAVVFAKYFAILLLPSLTITSGGAIGSVTAGFGLTL
jgi:hypothetical protein